MWKWIVYDYVLNKALRGFFIIAHNTAQINNTMTKLLTNTATIALRKNSQGYDWIKKLSAANNQLSTKNARWNRSNSQSHASQPTKNKITANNINPTTATPNTPKTLLKSNNPLHHNHGLRINKKQLKATRIYRNMSNNFFTSYRWSFSACVYTSLTINTSSLYQ